MARRSSTTPVRIYKYGVPRPSKEAVERIQQELFHANRYYNQLIEIDRKRREAFANMRTSWSPELAGLESDIDQINAQLTGEVDKDKLKDLRAKRKELSDLAKPLRKAFLDETRPGRVEFERRKLIAAGCDSAIADQIVVNKFLKETGANKIEGVPEFKIAPHLAAHLNEEVFDEMAAEGTWSDFFIAQKSIDMGAVSAIKEARSRKSVGAPTSTLVEQAFEVSKRESSGAPQFRRFSREGRIGGQVHNATVDELFSEKPGLIRFDPITRNGKWAGTTGRMYLGTKESGERDEIEFPVRWHRDLPKDAVIKWAWLLVRKLGSQYRYELQLTLESNDVAIKRKRASGGVADVHLGWSAVRGSEGESVGLRVCRYEGGDGETGECVLDSDTVDRLNMREAILRRFIDDHFNNVRARFRRQVMRWKKSNPERLPKWLTERPPEVNGHQRRAYIENIDLWKSPMVLSGIARRWVAEIGAEDEVGKLWKEWRQQRLSVDPKLDLWASGGVICRWLRSKGVTDPVMQLCVYLDWWRRKNDHLSTWGARQTDRAIRHRNQVYRNWAIDLAKKYKRIRLHDVDLTINATSKKERGQTENPLESKLRSQQRDAAPSKMRFALLEIFGDDVEVIKRERPGDERRSSVSRKGKKIAESAQPQAAE